MINALADDGEKLFEMSDIGGFMDALGVNGTAPQLAGFDGLLNHGSMAAHSGAEIGVRRRRAVGSRRPNRRPR